MSYGQYTPGSQPPPTSVQYPYGAYHPPPHAYTYQAPGAYQSPGPYQPWSYPYGYVPQTPQSAVRPTIQTAPPLPRATASPTPAPGPIRSTTFTSYAPSYARESVAAASTGGATGRGSRKQSNIKGLFSKELKNLMYGFGDDRNPASDTVNVMEEILIEYITDVCLVAGGPSKKSRLSIEDLRKALSRPADGKKLARMEELLFMQEDIKRARAQFEESDIQAPKY